MLINGPLACVRLEGKIDNKDKVIYLFFDEHRNPEIQMDCNNDEAVDIDKYLIDTFKNTNKKIDFFTEIGFLDTLNYRYQYEKGRYVDGVIRFFARNFEFDDKNNKVKISKKYENVRFHYADVRDRHYFSLLTDIMFRIEEIFNEVNIGEIYLRLFNDNDLMENRNEINFLTDKIKKIGDIKLVDKIKKKTNHNIVKSKLGKHLDEALEELKNLKSTLMKEYDKIIDNIKMMQMKDRDEKIVKNILDIQLKVGKIFERQICVYMDLYLLRRFLDKDYITNALAYTGYSHSLDMMNILVKDFDFKVSHITGNKRADLINKFIKENDYEMGIFAKYIIPHYFDVTLIPEQCINIKEFPKNFM